MAKDFSLLAKEILQHIGGDQNIHSLVHCATRLRFILKDLSKVDKQKLNQTAGVISIIESGGQFQIVIGNNVPKVYAAIMAIANIQQDDSQLPKVNLLNRAIDFLAGSFTPLIGVMAGSGILKGVIAILQVLGWLDPQSGTYIVLDATASSTFYFLPIFLAFSCATKLKTNPYIAVAVATALLYPSIIEASQAGVLVFLSFELAMMTYTYSVIPILLAVWAQSYILRWFEAIWHESVRNFFAPACTLLVVVPLTLAMIGPIGAGIGSTIASLLSWLYHASPVLTGLFVGAIWQVLVIFGIHWSIVPIMINNMSVVGFDLIGPITAAGVLGQAGATLAVFLKSRNNAVKSLAGSTTFSGILGITEPLIYGITLRFKKPFICGVIGGGIGGVIIALGGTKMFAFGFSGVLLYPVIIGPESNILAYSLGMLVAFSIACLLTYLFGYNDNMLAPQEKASQLEHNDTLTASVSPIKVDEATRYAIVSPLGGKIYPLATIDDPLFSSEALGKGVAILPEKGELYSPVNGTVSSIFATKHAINILSDEGVEILIHIGMDTVNLKGEHFNALVQNGDKIKAGQPLITFDIEAITQAGFSVMTPIIIANTEDYAEVIIEQTEQISPAQPLITVLPHN